MPHARGILNPMNTAQELRTKLRNKIAGQTTGQLFAAALLIDATEATRKLEAHELLTATMIATCIEDRHHLEDAIDAVFTDEFDGTYTEALLLAMGATGQAHLVNA